MSKHWVMTARVTAPDFVVSARDGGSVFFAGYSSFDRQWYLITKPNNEVIRAPQMLLLDEAYVKEHPSKSFREPVVFPLQKRQPAQLSLQFS